MKNIRKYIAIFLISLASSAGILVNDAAAFTEIMISPDDCTISIFLRKEFSVMTSPALTDWIDEIDGEIAKARATLNPGWFQNWQNRNKNAATLQAERAQAQDDLNWFTSKRAEVQNIINNYPVITDAQIEALAQKWKREIEDKWNAQNYLFDGHCKVRVVMAYVVRKETDPPHRGFDQIRIAPGDFRSYVEGDWNFDANGFSEFPYNNAVFGVWSMNSLDDYTAPHEAGHEMGLKDRYRDRPGGGVDVEQGYENDLYGTPVARPTAAQLKALTVISVGRNGLRVNNLETILNGRSIRCPPGGTPQNPRVFIDYSNIPFPGRDRMPAIPKDECTTCPSDKPCETGTPSTETPKDVTPTEPSETVQYRKDTLEDVSTDTAIVTKDTPEGKEIDISVLPTGKSTDFRTWEVDDITLFIDGQRTKPRTKENFYVDKGSYFRGAAALVITAIGTQYRPYAEEAESGKVCPVTGEKIEGGSSDRKTSRTDEAIDRAGVAAGMGLLASQAKGTITGKKCSFSLDKNTADKIDGKNDYARVTVINKSNNIERTVKVPLGN